MLDSENVWGTGHEAGRANSLSKSERTRLLKIVTDYFNERGMNIGIYASATWFTSHLDMSKFPQCVRDCTWVADSTGKVDYNGYYWLRQYGQATVAGCGKVDVNRVTNKIPSVRKGESAVKTPEKPKYDPVDMLLQIAQAQVGTKEGANNKTKFGDEMHAIQPSNMDKNAPWCDAFCDWCVLQLCRVYGYGADMARKVLCGDFDDYTYNSVNLYKKAGRWSKTPHRGDQIFFGGSGHTGWVKAVKDERVYTIEGNKSDAVRECNYNVSDSRIIGYGMPRYDLLDSEPQDQSHAGVLRKGSTGKAVRFLQLCLGGLEDDGSFGYKTLSRVLAFQKAHGLAQTGEVDPATWLAIKSTLPLLKRGSTGRYVKALQVALGGLDDDGSFGKLTYNAVTAFQRENRLESDGEVGPLTWGAIINNMI